ncbi:helix-turn-helix domain-containing protein [Ferrovum myxofaciens]|jgi:DNA-binding Xre family transcriptional regulator|uniref:helix-turn-helix domain-containing protein n=1 Tax=Ferrovum myxofaciens TaxID=416213 RepID=UPI003EB7F8AC
MEAKLKKRLTWRLRVMLAERNITTATELKRRLESYGYEITSSQLTRIIRERPERISTDLLDHLLAILRCEVTDLLRLDQIELDQADDNQPVVEKPEQPQKKRIRRVPDIEDGNGDITGPKVTPFPIPTRK